MINIDKIEKLIKKYDASGKVKITYARWHSEITIDLPSKNIYFRIKNMESGCGSALLYQYHGITNPDIFEEIFTFVANIYKEDGAGTIITTLGESYDSWKQLFLKLNFKNVATYNNYRHGDNYMQHLLVRCL